MKDYIDIFKSYLLNEKKASNNTVESYLRDINQFSVYCTASNINDAANIDTSVLQKYLEYLSVIHHLTR